MNSQIVRFEGLKQ